MMRIMYLLMGFSLKVSLVFADFNKQERSFKEEGAVTAVVFSDPKELVFDLIEVVSKAKSFGQRGELLKRLENYFDIAAMSRFVLGRAVTQIAPSQLTEFISLFGEYQLLIVIPKFESFSAQDLEFIGMRSLAEGDKFVLSFNYTQPNGGVVGLGFYVKKRLKAFSKFMICKLKVSRCL